MQRPLNHVLGELGELRFAEMMVERGWLLTKLTPDYGFDYLGQPVEKEGVTPYFALFQVKARGVRSRRRRAGGRPIRVRREHIEFWRQVSLPSFLVVVELSTNQFFCVTTAHCAGVASETTASKWVSVALSDGAELNDAHETRIRHAVTAYWRTLHLIAAPATSALAAALVGSGAAGAIPLLIGGGFWMPLLAALVRDSKRTEPSDTRNAAPSGFPNDAEHFKAWFKRRVLQRVGGA
jgi:hypothetical protein